MSNKIKLKQNKTTEVLEVFFSVAGLIFPVFSLASLGFNLINKQYENENLEMFKEYIEKLYIKIESLEEITEENKRNFSFNAQKTLEKVIRERAIDKIELIARLFTNSINNKIIFEDKDDYEETLKIISDLNLYEINILRTMDKEKKVFSEDIYHEPFDEGSIKSYQVINMPDKQNVLGLDHFDFNRINKLVSLGLIEEIMKYDFEYVNVPAGRVVKGVKNKKEYKLTEFYDKVFNFLTPQSDE